MSESDTTFNERDRRCAAVQLMSTTDPSSDNRTIASTIKRQILTGSTLKGTAQRIGRPFGGGYSGKATSCHLTSSKSAWKSTSKCIWMCWRVWWSPGAIRWPVADSGVWQQDSAPAHKSKRDPGLASEGVHGLCTLLSLAPFSSDLNPLDFFVWSYVEKITNMTSHSTKASLIAAIRRLFAELLPAFVEKACSQFRIRIETVIEAECGYIE